METEPCSAKSRSVEPPASNRPVRLLLINPALPESFWSFSWWVDMAPGKRAVNLPLGLATLAALCAAHWQVSIWLHQQLRHLLPTDASPFRVILDESNT